MSALAGAYALDALDEQERALFEAHLATCADCAAEVRSLRAAAAELSHATATTPPASLRADVLAAVEHTRQLPPGTTAITDPMARRRRQWWWPAVAAACVLIALASAGWGYQQHRELDQHRARTAAITTVLESPDASTVTGTIAGTGHATILYSKAERRLVLIGNDIADPAGNKTYQLWMIDPKGTATSAGLFKPDSNGNVLVQASGDLDATARVGISIERAGGAPEPTPGAIVATMAI